MRLVENPQHMFRLRKSFSNTHFYLDACPQDYNTFFNAQLKDISCFQTLRCCIYKTYQCYNVNIYADICLNAMPTIVGILT